ncbi:MAG: hypothetical protein R2839_02250 [Thermomicrobiales bacterium]
MEHFRAPPSRYRGSRCRHPHASQVWEASGHVVNFNDPLVDCKTCKSRFRADHLIEERLGMQASGKTPDEMSEILREANLACPHCGNRTLTDVASST